MDKRNTTLDFPETRFQKRTEWIISVFRHWTFRNAVIFWNLLESSLDYYKEIGFNAIYIEFTSVVSSTDTLQNVWIAGNDNKGSRCNCRKKNKEKKDKCLCNATYLTGLYDVHAQRPSLNYRTSINYRYLLLLCNDQLSSIPNYRFFYWETNVVGLV